MAVHHKGSQHLITHRVYRILDYTQDVKPAQQSQCMSSTGYKYLMFMSYSEAVAVCCRMLLYTVQQRFISLSNSIARIFRCFNKFISNLVLKSCLFMSTSTRGKQPANTKCSAGFWFYQCWLHAQVATQHASTKCSVALCVNGTSAASAVVRS